MYVLGLFKRIAVAHRVIT